MDDRGLISLGGGGRNCSLLENVKSGSGTHPFPYPVGTGILLRIKRRVCEIDQLSPSSTEFKNEWTHTCDNPVCLCGMDHRSCNMGLDREQLSKANEIA